MRWLLAATALLAGPASAQYVIEQAEEAGPELLPFALTQQLRYADAFAVESLAVAADGSEVAAVTRASRAGVKAWLTDGRTQQLPPMPTAVAAVAYGPSLGSVAVALVSDALSDHAPGVRVYDLKTGRPGPVLAGSEGARAVAFSPDGEVLVAAVGDGVVGWASGTSRTIAGIAQVQALGFASATLLRVVTPDEVLLVAVADGRIEERRKLPTHRRAAATSPDGRFAIVDTRDGFTVHDLWAPGPPQKVDTPAQVAALAWSADGRLVVAGTDDGRLLLYAVTGAERALPTARTPWVEAAGNRRGDPEDTYVVRDDRGDDRDDRGTSDAGRDDRDVRSRDDRDDPTASDNRGDDRRGYSSRRAEDEAERRGQRWDEQRPQDGKSNWEDDFANRRDDPGVQTGVGKEAAPEVTARWSAVVLERLGGDPRESEVLVRTLVDDARRMERCWKRAGRKGEPTSGTLRLPLTITAGGEARGFGTPEDGIGSGELLRCLEDRLQQVGFPAGLGNLDIELTLVLEQGR